MKLRLELLHVLKIHNIWSYFWRLLSRLLPSFFLLLVTSVLPSPLSLLQATESELGDVDLSGLPEAAVDSEEEEEEDEDLERASDTLLGRDLVRECLEKDPADRNDDDIGQ